MIHSIIELVISALSQNMRASPKFTPLKKDFCRRTLFFIVDGLKERQHIKIFGCCSVKTRTGKLPAKIDFPFWRFLSSACYLYNSRSSTFFPIRLPSLSASLYFSYPLFSPPSSLTISHFSHPSFFPPLFLPLIFFLLPRSEFAICHRYLSSLIRGVLIFIRGVYHH